MAKRRPSSTSPPKQSLAEIDRQIVALLNVRASHAKAESTDLADPQSWQTLQRRLARANNGPLTEETLDRVFRELQSGIRQLRRPVHVAYLGPPYSYSHLAAIHRFGLSAVLVPVQAIPAVFEEVRTGNCDFGLVPLDNSTDGRIADTLDSFARRSAPISGEVPMRIHHHLLGIGRRDEIRIVCSKPQAISQCRQWLARHLPTATLEETASTTAAAERAAASADIAAVASREAGKHYGLKTLAANIEDHPDNLTRFAVIGGNAPSPTGQDKMTVMFELSHQPGALATAIGVFRRYELNLTWVESFPMPDTPNEYLFFVELEGHLEDPQVQQAIRSLKPKTNRLEVLGSYPRSPVLE